MERARGRDTTATITSLEPREDVTKTRSQIKNVAARGVRGKTPRADTTAGIENTNTATARGIRDVKGHLSPRRK
jgi:hypothetical protein